MSTGAWDDLVPDVQDLIVNQLDELARFLFALTTKANFARYPAPATGLYMPNKMAAYAPLDLFKRWVAWQSDDAWRIQRETYGWALCRGNAANAAWLRKEYRYPVTKWDFKCALVSKNETVLRDLIRDGEGTLVRPCVDVIGLTMAVDKTPADIMRLLRALDSRSVESLLIAQKVLNWPWSAAQKEAFGEVSEWALAIIDQS